MTDLETLPGCTNDPICVDRDFLSFSGSLFCFFFVIF
jgi:hypothetical protein